MSLFQFCAALPAMLFLSPLPTARSTPPSPTSEPLCLILHALLQRSAEKEERAALVGCGGHWRLLSWMSRAALHAGDELVEVTVVGPSADLLALVASAAGVLLTILCVDNAIIAAQPAAKVKGKKGKKGKAKRRLVENGWLASIGALARACVKLGTWAQEWRSVLQYATPLCVTPCSPTNYHVMRARSAQRPHGAFAQRRCPAQGRHPTPGVPVWCRCTGAHGSSAGVLRFCVNPPSISAYYTSTRGRGRSRYRRWSPGHDGRRPS